ncbi:MAG: hypothetical protein DCF15_19055 [Phormidesmis priestleyi]|uniref:Putative restriction endonuclease domain-containing protein n=1 Tax=Phormidesmis priestleyi TaxID=268141 RepID=A0A2W4WQI0_9CYAN|nr:MAG: hypothetical protein DCF15_19055 [Phormidesmis priestleyi]
MPSSSQSSERSPQQALQNYCGSQAIDLQFCQRPEFRLELLGGQFLVGGTLEGSRWLLREALIGWGLEAAIAFAPINQWWEALRLAYEVPFQTAADWLTWADALPLSSTYRDTVYPPLGSKYVGEHRWVQDYLRQAISVAVDQARWGRCFGPNYGMLLGRNILTPDILVLATRQLAQNIAHDYYTEIPACLVIEVLLPEQSLVDRRTRKVLYEQAQIQHYWIVDPATKQIEFWRWSLEGYQLGAVDSDGYYREIADLSFSPEIFWLSYEQSQSPYQQRLAAFTSARQPRQWELRKELGIELGYGSVPFNPAVGLTPQPIGPEQFISWCPETKLESPPFPLIGGETGTRNAIALLLMSLGLVETIKLMAGYEWVRALRRVARQQQQDTQQRSQWWQRAREIAQQLKAEMGVGGVGVIGSLVSDQPLNQWSQIDLILWDVPKSFNTWRIFQSLPDDIPFELTEVARVLPGNWEEISQRMQVLEGTWGDHEPRPQKRMVFHWLDADANS